MSKKDTPKETTPDSLQQAAILAAEETMEKLRRMRTTIGDESENRLLFEDSYPVLGVSSHSERSSTVMDEIGRPSAL